MPNADVVAVATDSGMLALWRGSAFAEVDRYDAWEERVNERLDDAIQSGELVPIGIQGDGASGVRVAVAPDGATERETQYTVVTSEPYLLVADGGPILLSGIESVGDESSSPMTLSLPEGRYAVRATIVAWDEEPGARGPDDLPGPNALADRLVAIAPSDGSESFRTSEITFDQPDSNIYAIAADRAALRVVGQEEGPGCVRHLASREANDPIWRMDHPDVHVMALGWVIRVGDHDSL